MAESARSQPMIQENGDTHSAVNIQFTSGTTGAPKGATLTNHNIVNNGRFIGEAMMLKHGDRLLCPVPLYHCFGMVIGNMACFYHGATIIYPSPNFDPAAVLATIEKEKCTAMHGVPTMFVAEMHHPQFAQTNFSHLRTGVMAGSLCPAETMHQVMTKLNLKEITICYGMTETSPVSFQVCLVFSVYISTPLSTTALSQHSTFF